MMATSLKLRIQPELEELVEETTDLSEIEDIQDLGQVLYPADRLQSPLTPALAGCPWCTQQ